MRAALLAHHASIGSGIGNQVAEKLAFFHERGADVRVFIESERDLDPAIRPHCRLLDYASPRGEGWKFLASADLAIVEHRHGLPQPEVLPLLAGKKPCLVLDLHSGRGEALPGERSPERFERVDAVVVHDSHLRQELAADPGWSFAKVFSLGYSIPTDFWRPGAPERDLRDRLKIGPSVLVLWAGSSTSHAGLVLLAATRSCLTDLSPEVHALIACPGPGAAMEGQEAVHFLGDLSSLERREAYRSADVFVLPENHPDFRMAALEAMACGLPVVAAGGGAVQTLVAGAGLTFSPGVATDLAQQLKRVLTPFPSPARQNATGAPSSFSEGLRRRGLERARQHDRAIWRMQFAEIVEQLLHDPVRQGRGASSRPTVPWKGNGASPRRIPLDRERRMNKEAIYWD